MRAAPDQATPAVTRDLAAFAVGVRSGDLPAEVRREAPRALLNILGCMLGGCDEPAVLATLAAAQRWSGPPQASVIGHAARVDVLHAALVNAVSSAVLVFDDTHWGTVLHPSGPVAAALLAVAEEKPASGADFAVALLVGIEVACRAAVMLAAPPAECSTGFSMTGLVGGIGAAAAAGRLLGLDRDEMEAALGTAAAQGAGFRQTHSSMAGYLVPAQGARAGLMSAMLAQDGFTCSPQSLEGPRGFGHVFASQPNFTAALAGLGTRFELLSNTYKPYPCGVVIHPIIDACLEIVAAASGARIDAVDIEVHPLAIELTSQRHPADEREVQVSLYHWAAAALLRGRAGLAESQMAVIADPAVAALRDRIEAQARADMPRQGAVVRVRYADGSSREAKIEVCRGSLQRPMSDEDLADKFLELADRCLDATAAGNLLDQCLALERQRDVAAFLQPFLNLAAQRHH